MKIAPNIQIKVLKQMIKLINVKVSNKNQWQILKIPFFYGLLLHEYK